MKHATFFLIVALVIAAIAGGCASWFAGTEPMLGRYSYVRKPINEGPALRTIPIWIDKGFGEADKVAIDDAIRAWNYALNGYVKLVVVDTSFDMEVDKIVTQVKENGWLFMKIDSKSPLIPSQKTPGYWTIGFTERLGGHHLYLVRDRLGNEDVFGVTLHEIGHLMGSDHVGSRLMYPHYTRARFQCIDYDTIFAVASYNNLPLNSLNYCYDKDMSEAEKLDPPDGGPILSNCPIGNQTLGKQN